MRLNKFLAEAGLGSRRKVEELITAGRVSVNGEAISELGTQVEAHDQVRVDGERVRGEKKVYYLLNKPRGYLCTNNPLEKRKRVIDLFGKDHRLFSVGRLDRDTSGLLIVTNDGDFAQRIIHPSSGLVKEYVVKTPNEITPEHLKTISKGARVERKWVKPVLVKKVRRGTLKVHIKEGRKHEVRLLVARANLEILELKRTRIGNLQLGEIPEGHFRPLSFAERNLFSE